MGENFLSITIADALCEKLGGDSLQEMLLNYQNYREQLSRGRRQRPKPGDDTQMIAKPSEGDKE